jgi:CheY-like chemotaxis protein
VHVEAFSTVGEAPPNELAIEIPEHRTSASAGNSTIFVPQKEEDQLQWLPCEASARTIYKVHLKGFSQEAARKGVRAAPSSTVCSVTVPTDRVVKVRFEVEDNGCGISAADQQKLFQAFVQINAAETQGGKGTGLGLYICKEIAARHGGAVGVISEVRVRTVFWFEASFRVMWQSEMSDEITPSPVSKLNLTISSSAPHALYKGKYYAPSLDSPFAAGQQSSTLLAELSSPNNINPVASASTQTMRIGDLIEVTGTVLIVDDDASQRLLLMRLIRRWTTATLVVEAANGVDAEPLLTQHMSTLSLIMLDFNMPGYDCGDKVCATFRSMGYTGTIAGLTGDGDTEKQRFLKAGANCVIHKPLDRNKFNDIFKTNSAMSLLGDGSQLSMVS